MRIPKVDCETAAPKATHCLHLGEQHLVKLLDQMCSAVIPDLVAISALSSGVGLKE